MTGIDEWEESIDKKIEDAEAVSAQLTDAMADCFYREDDAVLTMFWITPRMKPSASFEAAFATWGKGSGEVDPLCEMSFFRKNPIKIQKKMIPVDSAMHKVAACLKSGCKVTGLEVVHNGSNYLDEKSRKKFNLKLVGTEVILEPVA